MNIASTSDASEESRCLVGDTDEDKCLKCACYNDYKYLLARTRSATDHSTNNIDQDTLNQIVRTVKTRGDFGVSYVNGGNSCEAYRAPRQFKSYQASMNEARRNPANNRLNPAQYTYAVMEDQALADACNVALETVKAETLNPNEDNFYIYGYHREIPRYFQNCDQSSVGSAPTDLHVFDCSAATAGLVDEDVSHPVLDADPATVVRTINEDQDT